MGRGQAGAKAKAMTKGTAKKAAKKASKGPKAKRAVAPPVVQGVEPADEQEPDEEDVEFVRQNSGSLSFLRSVAPESLVRVEKEPKEKRPARDKKQTIAPPKELSETEDEDSGDSDADLEIRSSDEEADRLVDLVLSDADSDVESMTEDEDLDEGDDSEEDLDADDSDHDFANSKVRRAQKRKAMFGGEMDYEQAARAFVEDKKPKLSNKLPIKTSDGRLALPEYSDDGEGGSDADSEDAEGASDTEGEDDSDGSGSESGDKPAGAAAADQGTSGSVPDRKRMSRKAYIVAQQNRLAALADTVMQDPESQLEGLKTLHAISDDKDPQVRRLGLLTQLAVFSDILPGYRIRELTEKEKQMKVTKDVQQQRQREERLVQSYSRFLKQLFVATKSAMKIFGDANADIETGVVATRALGTLVTTHPHFNYRKDVVAALVDIYVQPPSRINFAPFVPMAQAARLAVLRLFRDDVSGEYSHDTVVLASKRIKRLSYRVDPSALRPWLHLRLCEELRENPEDRKRADEDRQRKERLREERRVNRRKKGGAALKEAKRALHVTRKQAKMRKVQRDVDRSMAEAEAEVSREEREKWFGETLKQVFITYFRILKQKDNIGALLPAVLEGLARYAHLISVEFFVDLFRLLKRIMRGQHGVGVGAEESEESTDLLSSRVGLRTALLCILTALHILTGQGEALNLDIKDFFYQLYALLPALAASPQIESTRLSVLSDGTRYTVYLTPAEVAAANAAQAQPEPDANGEEQAAAWEDTVRSESDLMFECLELMFLGRTRVSSSTRVAAFCKRVGESALYWPPRTAVKAIEFIQRLLIKYPVLDRLLSSEDQAGSGLYLQDLDDPDMCNPFATCLFELHWLQIHHHHSVQAAAARLIDFARAELKKRRM